MESFWAVSARVQGGRWGEHWVLVAPDLQAVIKSNRCFLRLDSGCLSGIFGDITCDCLEQLRKAQQKALEKSGVIIHIPEHDGRGWKEFKRANQRIMYETNLDTIAVAQQFYGSERQVDIRTFDESALILKALGFPAGYQFDLGTKNPKKSQALTAAGFVVDAHEVSVEHKSGFLEKNLKAKYQFFVKQENMYAQDQKR